MSSLKFVSALALLITTVSAIRTPPKPPLHVLNLTTSTTIPHDVLNLTTTKPPHHIENLVSRLEAGSLKQCWDSLMELKSCSGEVVLFFLNGETYLGPSCCKAIGVIEKQCWAADAMLAGLGFTAQEGDVLRGYCDASTGDDTTGGISSPVTPGPIGA